MISDLKKISETVQKSAIESMKEKDEQIFLYLPATVEDALNLPVINHIINVLKEFQKKHTNCIDHIVLGVDGANSKEEFEKAIEHFRIIPNFLAINNSNPKILEVYRNVERVGSIAKTGKGRNMWTGLGLKDHISPNSVFVTHDCDILPEYYNESFLLSLIAPIIDPLLNKDFVKAYYLRLKSNGKKFSLSGRVKRLLVTPLLEALDEIYGADKGIRNYLSFLMEFKYPLSGEFAMKADVANNLIVQPDWGLEISTLNFLYGNRYKIAQVDLGIYDHKHSAESENNPNKGLNRMATEISKTLFREMYAKNPPEILKMSNLKKLLVIYENKAKEEVIKSFERCYIMGWDYDEIRELQRVKMFTKCIKMAFDIFMQDPEGLNPLPNWGGFGPQYSKQIYESINQKKSKEELLLPKEENLFGEDKKNEADLVEEKDKNFSLDENDNLDKMPSCQEENERELIEKEIDLIEKRVESSPKNFFSEGGKNKIGFSGYIKKGNSYELPSYEEENFENNFDEDESEDNFKKRLSFS